MAITYDNGSSNYTADYSTNYAMIEKIAKQLITGVKSTNPLAWINKGKIKHGVAIEHAVVELAQSYVWDEDNQDGSKLNEPSYPAIQVQYYKEWNGKQFKKTVSESQIDKVILAGGDDRQLAEEVAASLTEGEGYEDYEESKGLLVSGITSGNIVSYGDAITDANAIVKAIHNVVHSFQFVNTNYVKAGYKTRTPFERIHIIMPYTVYEDINVDFLASVFNLSKAELLSKITLIDEGTKIFIVDEWALLKYDRIYKMTSKYVEDALYTQYWLTVSRMYGTCNLFKAAYIETSASGSTTGL